MYCSECGKLVKDQAKFCGFCGATIQQTMSDERKKLSAPPRPVKRISVKRVDSNNNRQAGKPDNPTPTPTPTPSLLVPQNTNNVVVNTNTAATPAVQNSISPSFYLFDFFKKMFRVKNIGVLIYLSLNLAIITFVLLPFQTAPSEGLAFAYALLEAILLYGASLAISLSPFGEWVLRFQNGCKPLKRQDQIDYLMPLFERVYNKAKKEDPTLSDNIQLFIMEDDVANAFATGRRTVCVTTGLLKLKPEKIEGALAHEFGHLSHHDTDLLLLVAVGNFVVTAIILAVRVLIWILYLISSLFLIILGGWDGVIGVAINTLLRFLTDVTISVLAWLWTKVGILLCMHSSRGNEFEADKFAFDLGYGNELCAALDTICGPGAKGLFATLVSSHPDKSERISKLQSYGATYRAQVGVQYGIK